MHPSTQAVCKHKGFLAETRSQTHENSRKLKEFRSLTGSVSDFFFGCKAPLPWQGPHGVWTEPCAYRSGENRIRRLGEIIRQYRCLKFSQQCKHGSPALISRT